MIQTFHTQRRKLSPEEYQKRAAQPSDYVSAVDGGALVYEGDKLMVAVVDLHDKAAQLEPVRRALKAIKFRTDYRTSGLLVTSRTFGYQPRNTLRRDFCSVASLANDMPREHALIAGAASIVADEYARVNPLLYARHSDITEAKVLQQYRLGGTPFTSGIANDNNPLWYHHDRGNFKDVWSGMLVFRSGVEGGVLSLPEYSLGLELPDLSLLLFDGQGLLHGVTPITKTRPDGHRFSVVYYSMQGMWSCLTPAEEVKRIQKLRTEREAKRAAGQSPRITKGKKP